MVMSPYSAGSVIQTSEEGLSSDIGLGDIIIGERIGRGNFGTWEVMKLNVVRGGVQGILAWNRSCCQEDQTT